jgi:hypothetical protein
VVKTVVRPLFERIPDGALSAEKRTEFFCRTQKSVNGQPCGQPRFIVYAASLFQSCL